MRFIFALIRMAFAGTNNGKQESNSQHDKHGESEDKEETKNEKPEKGIELEKTSSHPSQKSRSQEKESRQSRSNVLSDSKEEKRAQEQGGGKRSIDSLKTGDLADLIEDFDEKEGTKKREGDSNPNLLAVNPFLQD